MRKHRWNLDVFPGVCEACGIGYLQVADIGYLMDHTTECYPTEDFLTREKIETIRSEIHGLYDTENQIKQEIEMMEETIRYKQAMIRSYREERYMLDNELKKLLDTNKGEG